MLTTVSGTVGGQLRQVSLYIFTEYSRLCRRHAIPYQYPQFQPGGEQTTILPYCPGTTAMQATCTSAVRTYE